MTGEHQITFFHDGKIKTWRDLDAFDLPDQSTGEYQRPLPEFVEGVSRARLITDGDDPLWRLCHLSGDGLRVFFLLLIDDPDLPETLMRRYAEWIADLLPVLNQLGFDIIHNADNVAGQNGPLLSPEMFRERFWPPVHEVGDAARAHQQALVLPQRWRPEHGARSGH